MNSQTDDLKPVGPLAGKVAPIDGGRAAAPLAGLQLPLIPTGTEGRPIAAPKLAAGRVQRIRGDAIPMNVAFREILQIVQTELNAAGEQWNDEARQGAVSTLFIAAGKAGWLTVWERGGA